MLIYTDFYNFSLELIATCYGKQSDLVMYFTGNTAFMHYFDNLTDALDFIFYKIRQDMNRSYQFHYKCLILIQNY